jgi:hypothetical protein
VTLRMAGKVKQPFCGRYCCQPPGRKASRLRKHSTKRREHAEWHKENGIPLSNVRLVP